MRLSDEATYLKDLFWDVLYDPGVRGSPFREQILDAIRIAGENSYMLAGPAAPDTVYAITSSKVKDVINQQLLSKCVRYPDYNTIDTAYITVTYKDMKELLDIWWRGFWTYKLEYEVEKWDCDDYAALFFILSKLVWRGLAVGEVWWKSAVSAISHYQNIVICREMDKYKLYFIDSRLGTISDEPVVALIPYDLSIIEVVEIKL